MLLIVILKSSKNRKRVDPYIITNEVQKVFKKLKNTFFSILVLQYFDSSKLIYIKIDALEFAITDILSQLSNLILS